MSWGTPPSNAWTPPTPPQNGNGRAIAIIVLVAMLVAGAAGAGAVIAFRATNDNGDHTTAASPTTSPFDSPSPTAPPNTTNPLDNLGGLGGLGGLGSLGNLGSDPTQLIRCLGTDIGDLFGNNNDIPNTNAAAQYRAVVKWVEKDRGLRFTKAPAPTYVTASEMTRRVAAQIRHDYSAVAAARDEAMLVALGAIPPSFDLRTEYAKFVGGQVAGYYDADHGDMVILGNPQTPLNGTQLTTLAHELEHALADQNLHLPNATKSTQAQNDDSELAATALVEGDATLTMTQFQLSELGLSGLLSGDPNDIAGAAQSLNNAPPFLAQQLLFPYTDGLSFVCALRIDGGWTAVNRAYQRPPTTSAQIMFPDRYTNREGARAVPAATAGAGWERVRPETFGAADLMFLFEAPGGSTSAALSDARNRAAAWAGGTITLWSRGNDRAASLSLAGREASPSLCASMQEWRRAAFAGGTPNNEHVTVRCHGAFVQAGFAPDTATADHLAQ